MGLTSSPSSAVSRSSLVSGLKMKFTTQLCQFFGLGAVAFSMAACQDDTTAGTQNAAVPNESIECREQSPVANTQFGSVKGFVDDGVISFKGIRYGADTASTRFVAPAAPNRCPVIDLVELIGIL